MLEEQTTSLNNTASSVSVLYCSEEKPYHIQVAYQQGMTVMDAIKQSRIADLVELPSVLQVGIFALKINDPENYVLQVGDRVEIYRPLKLNPKEVRRRRAERHPVGRVLKKGNQARRQS